MLRDERPLRISIPCTPPSYTPSTALPSPSVIRREVIMGGIVSHPSTPGCGDDEKKGMSIEVPGIVLTEPEYDIPRIPSPPPKQILLLSPTSLSLPLSPSTSTSEKLYSPTFAAFLHGSSRTQSNGHRALVTVKSFVLLGLVVLGGWHLWASLQCGEEVVVV